MKEKVYHAGIYTRLSNDDERRGESVSIENQKLILTEYVRKQGWVLVDTYVDDGWSGTNFERPDFQRMLRDIKDGRINLVIVKDLSRLGRNHVLVGQFTEDILPAVGCRFIALNNSIDTINRDNSSNDMMPFLNLFNEFHSRDTSRKVKSVKKSCAQRGMYMGTYAPYGYRKDPEDRHRLIPDPETAPLVQRIFRLRCEGKGFRGIASLLNEEHIPSPCALYYQRQKEADPKKESGFWNESTVQKIIRSEVYIGNLVQGKSGTLSYKSRKIVKKDQEDWIRVEGTHEPLVSVELWNQVCDMDAQKFRTRTPKSGDPGSIFTGLVHCADCGAAMRRRVEKQTRRDGSQAWYISFLCGAYASGGKSVCTVHTIYENALSALVLGEIRSKALLVAHDRDAIVGQILRDKDREISEQLNFYQKEIKNSEEHLKELDRRIDALYADKLAGSVPDGLFQSMMERYNRERRERAEGISDMKKRLAVGQSGMCDAEVWADTIKQYIFLEELNQSILLELIQRIEVGEAQVIDGRRVCDVKILYRLVGDISGIGESGVDGCADSAKPAV